MDVLAAFARSNVLIALDFDGTLAPIVADPERARMTERTRHLLEKVAIRYPCVVISGRSREDVLRRVSCVPVWHVSGNHGMEPWGQDAAYVPQVQEWIRRLKARLAGQEGVVIEDKRYSITVHYRQATNKRKAIEDVECEAQGLHDARLLHGKQSLSLTPRSAPHKGAALERARKLLACDKVIYVGDDETDEDAFSTAHPERLLGIRIGRRADSKAEYSLGAQREIDAFLRALISFRHMPHSRRR